MKNPYIVGRPIFDPKEFYGRKEEVESIISHIEKSIPISLVGQRGMGRTSLLHYISHPEVMREWLDPDHYMMLYLDFKGFGQYTKQQFWEEVLGRIEKISRKPKGVPVTNLLENRKVDFMNIYELIEDLSGNNIKLVFIFDGFDAVRNNSNFDRVFLDIFRHFITAYTNVTYVAASSKNLDELEHTEEVSPFFTYFDKMEIGFLKMEETKELILEPSRAEGMQFNEEDVDFVLDVAYCHPLLVQYTCLEIFQNRMEKGKIHGEKIGNALYKKIRESLCQKLNSYFMHYWNLLNNREKKKLKDLSKCSYYNCEKDFAIATLERYNLIRGEKDNYRPFSSIFREFCIKQKLKREIFGD